MQANGSTGDREPNSLPRWIQANRCSGAAPGQGNDRPDPIRYPNGGQSIGTNDHPVKDGGGGGLYGWGVK